MCTVVSMVGAIVAHRLETWWLISSRCGGSLVEDVVALWLELAWLIGWRVVALWL